MAIELPECWSDDLRMSVLFSPFKDRNINPHSYDGKMKFWKDLIPQFTVNNPSTLSVTLTQLMTVFTRKGKTPQCLGLVLESLVRDKTLSLASEYDHSLQVLNQKRNSWGAWGYQTLFISPVKWAVSSVAGKMLNMKPQIDCTTKFIITSHMDKQAYKLLAVIQSSEDQTKSARNILSRQEVQEHCCKTSVCDSKDLELLIDHMEAHGMLQKIICDFGIYYKFLPRGSKSTPITDVEHGIVKLKHSKELLESQMEAAHKEVNQLQSLIKQELRLGQKAKALRLLRKRKGMEKLLDSRLNSLTSIEEILEQIYSAESNALVAEAYKHGAAALKMTNQQTPISQVDSIKDELADALNMSQEIGDALTTPTDNSELEEELNELLFAKSTSRVKPPSSPIASSEQIDDILLALDDMTINLPSVPSDEVETNSRVERTKLTV